MLELPEGLILSELSHDELVSIIESTHKDGFAWGVMSEREKSTIQYGALYTDRACNGWKIESSSKCTCQREEYKGILTGDEG